MFDSNANKEHALVGLRLEMLAGQFICSIFFLILQVFCVLKR